MATCLKSTWPASTAILVGLFIASQLLLGDYHHGHLPAVVSAKQQQQQASMPLGSSWPARDLSYLASPSKHFCFGWRQFPGASRNFYVAVWFAALDNAIVWVANRDAPASDIDSLQLTSDGNLLISNSIWQTDTASMGVSAIQIQDSGNVVLLQGNVRSYAWQSFSSPTDTLLPSQSFLVTQSLISRRPAYSTSLRSGNFKFFSPERTAAHIDYIIDASTIWEASSPSIALPVSAINSSVIAAQFTQSGVFTMYNISSGNAYFQLIPSDYNEGTLPASNPRFRRLTLDPDGNLRMYGWDYSTGKWIVLSEAVTNLCSEMSFKGVPVCGSYGVCVLAPEPACACPPGFHPADVGDVTQGCHPDNLPLPSCQNANQSNVNAAGITYVVLKNTDFLDNDILHEQGISLAACKDMCNSRCSCVGVVYDDSGSGTAATCWLKDNLLKGYSPQTQAGSRDVLIKIWNSTTATVMNPPSQSPTLAWVNSSAFWSQASVAQSAPVAQSCNPVATLITSSKHKRTAILAVSLISVGELLCFVFALFLLQKTNKCRHGKEELSPMQQTSACRAFSYAELVEATNDFRDPLGSGAFGAVVKGVLPDGTEIAVKKLQTSVMQLADSQFKAEIATLGRIHHMNLLRLYGYCADGPDHRLLVYEFIANGSLNRCLFEQSETGKVGSDGQHGGRADENQKLLASSLRAPRLDWRARYDICLGTARGLAYLHEDCLDCIVHCDIKPENILLDKDLCPKVADLGLAYLFGRNETLQVSNVRGTRGYLAPEWLSYLSITAKADVYSYGMVLIEIVSGRRNFQITTSAMDAGRWMYPSWVFQQVQTGHVEEVVDPNIRESGGIVYAEVEKVLRIAFLCLQQEAIARPTMRSIVQMLESSAAVPIPPQTSCSFEEKLNIAPGPDHANLYSSDGRYVEGPHFTIGSSISLLSGR